MKLLKYLKKELNRYPIDYSIFIIGGISFLFLLKKYQGQHEKTFILLLGFTLFYILWGAFHHLKASTLYLKATIEYILIGTVVLSLLKIIVLP